MKTFVAGVLALLLAACATERYYPVYLSQGDGYYIAEQNFPAAGYGASYDSLFALGVYPWWVHTFYSPYYYPYYFSYYHPFYYPYYGPYHFAGWSPSWPYHIGYQGHYSHGWPPYHAFRNSPPGPAIGGAPSREPGHGQAGGPVQQPVASERRRSVSGERSLAREELYRGALPHQPRGATPAPQRAMPYSGRFPAAPPGQAAAPVGQPVAPAAAVRPFPSEPARSHRDPGERSPAERDQ
jgi:hypothetical protein